MNDWVRKGRGDWVVHGGDDENDARRRDRAARVAKRRLACVAIAGDDEALVFAEGRADALLGVAVAEGAAGVVSLMFSVLFGVKYDHHRRPIFMLLCLAGVALILIFVPIFQSDVDRREARRSSRGQASRPTANRSRKP